MQNTMKKEVDYNLIVQSCPPLRFEKHTATVSYLKPLGLECFPIQRAPVGGCGRASILCHPQWCWGQSPTVKHVDVSAVKQ